MHRRLSHQELEKHFLRTKKPNARGIRIPDFKIHKRAMVIKKGKKLCGTGKKIIIYNDEKIKKAKHKYM